VSTTLLTRKVIVQRRPRFEEILQRALAGEELSVDDGELLLQAKCKNLQALVQTADEMRRRKVGDVVTYVKNRNINFTNICTGSCKFCAFRCTPKDPEAYVLSAEQIEAKVREAIAIGATEVCVQGGLHPDFTLENYLAILRAIRKVSSSIHIHAFSPSEIRHIAERDGLDLETVIKTLRGNGLNSVPGTAAEILVDRVRAIICPQKITAGQWVETVKSCHRLGLPTTATVMHGHVETPFELAQHIATVRDIQRETRGFTEFVLLPFVSKNTQLRREAVVEPDPDTVQSLRAHAVARLMLADYINNIQTSWVKLGPARARLMLDAGANDIGGTLMEESITRAAGLEYTMMSSEQLEELIIDAGRIPRQRTTTYELI